MFNTVTGVLEDFKIPLDNCLAIAVDNTNANVGAHNSLSSRLTAANPSIYTSGCVCHMIHNAAACGAAKLQVSLKLWRNIYRNAQMLWQHAISG